MKHKQFVRLSNHNKTRAFFSHEINTTTGKNAKPGPSLMAQTEFWNNWHKAFSDFENRLPS